MLFITAGMGARRWNNTVPTMPVKMNENSAVAIDAWIDNGVSRFSAGISRMPPTPTAPMKMPTNTATPSSQIMLRLAGLRAAGSRGHEMAW